MSPVHMTDRQKRTKEFKEKDDYLHLTQLGMLESSKMLCLPVLILKNGGSMRKNDFYENRCFYKHSDIRRKLDLLADMGYVCFKDDNRTVLVCLTPKGEELAKLIEGIRELQKNVR